MLKRATRVIATAAMLAGMAGCGSPEASCAAVSARVPATAAPGDTIDLDVANLFSTCHDHGEGPMATLTEVELALVSVDTAETVVATGRAEVAEDATAAVQLTIPDDATGTLSVEYDGVSLGTVTVSG